MLLTPLAHCCACGECKKGRNFANSSWRHSRCSKWSHSLVCSVSCGFKCSVKSAIFTSLKSLVKRPVLSLRCLHPEAIIGEQTSCYWPTPLLKLECVHSFVCSCISDPIPAVAEELWFPPSCFSFSDDAQQTAWVCFQEWEENNWLPMRGWKQMKEQLLVIFPDETYTVSYSACNSSRLCY